MLLLYLIVLFQFFENLDVFSLLAYYLFNFIRFLHQVTANLIVLCFGVFKELKFLIVLLFNLLKFLFFES